MEGLTDKSPDDVSPSELMSNNASSSLLFSALDIPPLLKLRVASTTGICAQALTTHEHTMRGVTRLRHLLESLLVSVQPFHVHTRYALKCLLQQTSNGCICDIMPHGIKTTQVKTPASFCFTESTTWPRNGSRVRTDGKPTSQVAMSDTGTKET